MISKLNFSIHIPNNQILSKNLANYTKGLEFLWNEIPVTITFESDWKQAKAILTEIISRHEKNTSFKAEQRVKEKTHLKGYDYEDQLEMILNG